MRTTTLGSTTASGREGLDVSVQGLGCMGMSDFYTGADRARSLETLARALDLGVTFFDTSDMYGSGANEELLGEFFARGDNRARTTLATKFAIDRSNGGRTVRGDAAYVKAAAEASLRRLGTDVIDLYYMHRRDVNTPIEETVGAMAELVTEGKVRHLGLSEVTPEEIAAAAAVHPITAVQMEWSLFTRDIEETVVPAVRGAGAGLVVYSPLGRGFLSGAWTDAATLDASDFRRSQPRFTGDNARRNAELLEPVRRIAKEHDASPAQVALAWVHARPSVWGLPVVPIPGTTKRERLEENAAGADLVLSAAELAELEPIAAAVVGDRYSDMAASGAFNTRA